MESPKPPDAIEIYKHACRFYVTIDRMHVILRQEPRAGDMLIPPMLVLTAFACELFLTAQIMAEGGQLHSTHNLKALFDQLKTETQRAIEAEWDEIMAKREPDTKKLDAAFGEPVPRGLRQALDASKKSFQQLRYLYQTNAARSFIAFLPIALNKAIMGLHPDWKFLEYAVKDDPHS